MSEGRRRFLAEGDEEPGQPAGPHGQAPEQSGQADNPGKGKKQKGGNRNLYREVDDLRREVNQLKAKQLADCAFCKGTGKMLDDKDKPVLDDNDLPQPCPVCRGTGKNRI